jgi:hypothetical protein
VAARNIGGDQRTAENLPDDRAGGQRDGVQPDRALAPIAGEVQLDAGQRLRKHQRGAGSLQDTREDEQERAWRQAAQQ